MGIDIFKATKEEVFERFKKENISKNTDQALEQTKGWTDDYVVYLMLQDYLNQWHKEMRLHWDEGKSELVCDCGTPVSDMCVKIKVIVGLGDYEHTKGGISYATEEWNYKNQILICDCGAEMKVELWNEETPGLDFKAQPDGSFKGG